MRLINTSTLKLEYFVSDIPDYVILSHTWGEEEVTFDDFDKPYAKDMAGYAKIEFCCKQACSDGFEYAWVDACCIDKKSSAELSEAINSMYNWYWKAEICYAYLSDISLDPNDHETGDFEFWHSRWFTRGWTLQELLAPTVVEFYIAGWRRIGTKNTLCKNIFSASRISKQFLLNRESIKYASISEIFFWASARQTTRQEDMAYCLMGLVNVNMPLLYGEGYRAFYRLQQEIMRRTNDHSIFAWSPQDRHVLGMLAPSPEFFSAAQGIVSQNSVQSGSFEVTNNGLRIGLDYVTPVATPDQRLLVLLNCRNADCVRIGIWLRTGEDGRLHRDPSTGPEHITYNHVPETTAYGEMYILAETDPKDDSSRKTCNTSIEEFVLETNTLHSQHALVGLGSLVDVVALHSRGDNGDILCFSDDEYGGILIEDRFSSWTFLIAFGQYEHYPMFRVVEGFLFAEAKARLSQIFKDMCRTQRLNLEQDPNNWKRSECHLEWLSKGFVVIATVRKKRKSGSISWAWTVSIKHAESYEAVCFSQNNEASPADEDTKSISQSQSNLNERRHRLAGIWASHKNAVARRVQEKFQSLR